MLPAKLTVGTQDTCNVKQGSIGIASLFVLHSPKMNSNQYRTCTTVKSGPGGS
jgi:hypothetical protein